MMTVIIVAIICVIAFGLGFSIGLEYPHVPSCQPYPGERQLYPTTPEAGFQAAIDAYVQQAQEREED